MRLTGNVIFGPSLCLFGYLMLELSRGLREWQDQAGLQACLSLLQTFLKRDCLDAQAFLYCESCDEKTYFKPFIE